MPAKSPTPPKPSEWEVVPGSLGVAYVIERRTRTQIALCTGPDAAAHAALFAGARETLAALKAVCCRLDCNELVNRPNRPGNEYDQPAYDAAMRAIAKTEAVRK